jgi:hypothetical protein
MEERNMNTRNTCTLREIMTEAWAKDLPFEEAIVYGGAWRYTFTRLEYRLFCEEQDAAAKLIRGEV